MTTLQEAAMRQSFETWAKPILGDNPTWKESGECELAWQSWKAALAQHREQQPVCHGCGIPAGDVHMSTCKSGKWPSRVSNGDTAAPAPQAQDALQDIAAYIGVGGYNGATTEQLLERIRVEFDRLAALQSAQPVAQPLTDKRISWLWSESHNDTTDRMAFQVFARAIEAAHGINGIVEAATRPAIDAAIKQGSQLEQLHN